MLDKVMELAAAIRGGRVREIPGLAAAMASHDAAMDQLSQRPFILAEKQRLRAEAEVALTRHVAELVAQARTNALRPYDEEERALRQQGRALGADATDGQVRSQVARATRAQLLATQADRAPGKDAARAIYAEALLSGDADVVRTVGFAVRNRLQALAAPDKSKDRSALRDAAAIFEAEFDHWQRDNPSIVQRLDQIERGRGQTAILFDESAKFALKLFGVRLPKTAPELLPVPATTGN